MVCTTSGSCAHTHTGDLLLGQMPGQCGAPGASADDRHTLTSMIASADADYRKGSGRVSTNASGNILHPHRNSVRSQGRLRVHEEPGAMKPCPGLGTRPSRKIATALHCGDRRSQRHGKKGDAVSGGNQRPAQSPYPVWWHGHGVGRLSSCRPGKRRPATGSLLGFHFILSPPQPDAIVSRLLLTIELTTTAIAGLYHRFFSDRR